MMWANTWRKGTYERNALCGDDDQGVVIHYKEAGGLSLVPCRTTVFNYVIARIAEQCITEQCDQYNA